MVETITTETNTTVKRTVVYSNQQVFSSVIGQLIFHHPSYFTCIINLFFKERLVLHMGPKFATKYCTCGPLILPQTWAGPTEV